MTEDNLSAAIAAIKAGQRDLGKQLLQTVLRANPQNELAWLWMSGVVDTPQQKRDCLQRILAINPQNEMARKGMEQIAQSEAASFLSVFAPHTPPAPPASTPEPVPAPAQTQAPTPAQTQAPAQAELQEPPVVPVFDPVPIGLDDERSVFAPPVVPNAPGPVAPAVPLDLPPVTDIADAPCAFCGAPTGIDAICDACRTEQVIDCPSCARPNDVRNHWICECGENLQLYRNKQGMLDRERLGDVYAMRDYPASAVKQWKAAIEQHPRPQQLHRKIAEMYLKIGLIEQARMHNDLAKQK